MSGNRSKYDLPIELMNGRTIYLTHVHALVYGFVCGALTVGGWVWILT